MGAVYFVNINLRHPTPNEEVVTLTYWSLFSVTENSSLSAHRDKIKHISDISLKFETPYQPDVKVAVVLH